MFFKTFIFLMLIAASSLMAEVNVLAFAGSTRSGSLNKILVKEAARIARQGGAQVTVIDLADYPIPFYDGDLEAKSGMPLNARKIRQLMLKSQVIFIATPEYNASIPAMLKNLLDWTSRAELGGASRDAFQGKTFVLLSASPGRGGAARALPHLKTIIEDVHGTVFPETFSLPAAHSAFDGEGHLLDSGTSQKLRDLVRKVS